MADRRVVIASLYQEVQSKASCANNGVIVRAVSVLALE